MTKGALRWSSLPKRIDEHQNLMFSPNNIVDTDFDQPNSDAECFYGKKIDDITLVSCIEMWRQKWSMCKFMYILKKYFIMPYYRVSTHLKIIQDSLFFIL